MPGKTLPVAGNPRNRFVPSKEPWGTRRLSSGETRTGLTVTSAISLSLDPPTMLVCVNRNASAWSVIQRERHYCVNILDARHQHVADRFAGRGGVKGACASLRDFLAALVALDPASTCPSGIRRK